MLTLYAFSVENWKRPVPEVNALMGLLHHYLRAELNSLLQNGIQFRVIGQLVDLAGSAGNWKPRSSARPQTPAWSSTSRSVTGAAGNRGRRTPGDRAGDRG